MPSSPASDITTIAVILIVLWHSPAHWEHGCRVDKYYQQINRLTLTHLLGWKYVIISVAASFSQLDIRSLEIAYDQLWFLTDLCWLVWLLPTRSYHWCVNTSAFVLDSKHTRFWNYVTCQYLLHCPTNQNFSQPLMPFLRLFRTWIRVGPCQRLLNIYATFP